MATTSERLKQLLDEKGISQAELAKRTGINKGALSSYISGRYKPTLKSFNIGRILALVAYFVTYWT